MTESRSTTSVQQPEPAYDEGEIDLRAMFLVLISRWTLIRDIVLVAAIAAAAYAMLLPTSYEARSGVVLSKTRTQVTFDPTIKTLSSDEIAGAQSDQAARRNTLAGLVKNSAVADMVIKQIGADLPAPLQSPDRLTREVDGSISRTASDLIEIKMTWSDPAVA